MTELSKRIITSFFLLALFFLSININYLSFLVLISCFYLIFEEFYNLLKKIYFKSNKLKIYFLSFLSSILLAYLIIWVWFSLNSPNNFDRIYLFILISISITSDIGGYCFGKFFKGKKLTKISPNKTYSGMFGSYLMSIFIVYITFKGIFLTNYLILIILFISTVSQFGDLFISFLKRKANVKDTGKVLPGHGGILDRFDGLIFALLFGSLLKIII